jgi:hypothetical protein
LEHDPTEEKIKISKKHYEQDPAAREPMAQKAASSLAETDEEIAVIVERAIHEYLNRSAQLDGQHNTGRGQKRPHANSKQQTANSKQQTEG